MYIVRRRYEGYVWGDCEISFETETATGNYQWTDKQISQLVEMDE